MKRLHVLLKAACSKGVSVALKKRIADKFKSIVLNGIGQEDHVLACLTKIIVSVVQDLLEREDLQDETEGERSSIEQKQSPLTVLAKEYVSAISREEKSRVQSSILQSVMNAMMTQDEIALGEGLLQSMSESLIRGLDVHQSMSYQAVSREEEQTLEQGMSKQRTKRVRAPADPNCPKAPNAYQIFCKERPYEKSKWKSMSAAEKQPYHDQAAVYKKAKEQYLSRASSSSSSSVLT